MLKLICVARMVNVVRWVQDLGVVFHDCGARFLTFCRSKGLRAVFLVPTLASMLFDDNRVANEARAGRRSLKLESFHIFENLATRSHRLPLPVEACLAEKEHSTGPIARACATYGVPWAKHGK